jgi:hypothetical protein
MKCGGQKASQRLWFSQLGPRFERDATGKSLEVRLRREVHPWIGRA